MIEKIATVAVYVDDQDRALGFWIRKMGFEKCADYDMGNGFRWLEVSPRGAQSAIVICPRKLVPGWKDLRASIVFSCSDISSFCRSLERRGVKVSRKPEKMEWGTYASFMDEDGNEFMLKE